MVPSQYSPAYAWLMGYEDPRYLYESKIDNNGAQVISGINAASFPADVARIAAIPQAQRGVAVSSFYHDNFWTPMKLEQLVSQLLANRMLDMGVNAGMGTTTKLLQAAIITVEPSAGIVMDGRIGPMTLTAANNADQSLLLDAFRAQRLGRYQEIVDKNPADAVYLGTAENPGPWWRRAEA